MSRRSIVITCASDHEEIPVERFIHDGERWLWDSERSMPKFGDSDQGIPDLYGQPNKQVTDHARGKVNLHCPRGCPSNLELKWEVWTRILDDFSGHDQRFVPLVVAERYAMGQRGSGRG